MLIVKMKKIKLIFLKMLTVKMKIMLEVEKQDGLENVLKILQDVLENLENLKQDIQKNLKNLEDVKNIIFNLSYILKL